VSEILTRLIPVAFCLSFYTIFSHPYSPPKPCGYCTYLIMKQHVSFSPNLLHHGMTRFTYNDLRDLEREKRQTGLSFCRLTLLGMGLQQPISKWLWLFFWHFFSFPCFFLPILSFFSIFLLLRFIFNPLSPFFLNYSCSSFPFFGQF
jgi:hypothetical protein